MSAVQRLAKWRMVFSGWQLGTRPIGDPEGDAVRDHREVTLLLRAEVNALTALLLEKKVFGGTEYSQRLEVEAAHLSKGLEQRFPGFKAIDGGMQMDVTLAAKTMEGWRP